MQKIRVYWLKIFMVSTLVVACRSSEVIVEDFRTETYNSRMAYFAGNPLRDKQIVFFGNSITQAGNWELYFPGANVANRGISGDNTEGMLARMDEIVAAKPEKFFIMAGINDISLSRPEKKIIDNYRKIMERIKTGSPGTEIYIQSVLPINNDFERYSRLKGKEKRILSLNQLLRVLAQSENVPFVNLYPYFTDTEGRLREEFTGDGLHLTQEAYRLWADMIYGLVK